MASNGSVVAESKQDSEKSRGGKKVSPNTAASKPEVARKPQLPPNRPCPPVPKKPPVAHKSPAVTQNHEGTPTTAPVALPNSKIPQSSNSGPITPARPRAVPGTPTAPAPTPQDLPPSPAPKPIGKTPPPLPKTPPKGELPSKQCKEPPPRPSPLSANRKAPPPIPAKKPMGRKPAVQHKAGKEGSQLTGQPVHQKDSARSYEHVVVTKNDVAETDRHSEGSTKCGSDTTKCSTKVVVEDISSNVDDINLASHSNNCLSNSPLVRPKSYENVVLKNNAQHSSSDGPHFSCDEVVVEESGLSETDNSASVSEIDQSEDIPRNEKYDVSNVKSEGSEDCALHLLDSQTPVSDTKDQASCPQSSIIKNDVTVQDTQSQMAPEHCVQGENTKSNTQNRLPLGDSEQFLSPSGNVQSDCNPSEKWKACDAIEKHSKNIVEPVRRRHPKERPARPAPPVPLVPPPLRPKPKKRTSLLRQSQIVDEDCAQENKTSQVADSLPSHNDSISVPNTPDHLVEEALYQEIDELDLPKQHPTDKESPKTNSAVSESDGEPAANGFVASLISASASSVQSSSEYTTEHKAPSKESVEQDVCEEGSTSNKETNVSEQTNIDAVETDIKGNTQQSEVTSVQKAETSENHNEKNTTEDLRKSTETLSLDDVEETSSMLKDIEQLLKVKLGSEVSTKTETTNVLTSSQSVDTPVRPPRPRRADRLRKLTVSICSADNSSTESLNSIDSCGKKAPPKPKRKHPPGSVNRSLSDVTGMQNYIDQLTCKQDEEEEEEKPFLPPRQQSLRSQGPKPPPLPPRNKSMERTPENKSTQDQNAVEQDGAKEAALTPMAPERRVSAPNVGTSTPPRMVRSASGAKLGKKHMPRPTRKAPPPPPQAPKQPLSMTAPSSSESTDEQSKTEKVPGYQKIASGLVSTDDINTVVPKSNVVGSIDSPGAGDVSFDHDYHEIPDHLIPDLPEPGIEPVDMSKEGSPPPVLPPRGYSSSSQAPAITTSEHSASSETSSKTSSDAQNSLTDSFHADSSESTSHSADPEAATSTPEDQLLDQLSAEDSTSQSSQRSSRPDSFCSEVLGSLLHVVGHHVRPPSTHSSSSHSEAGSGEVDVPTFDHSSGSESENEEDEEKMEQKREKKVHFIAEEVMKSEQVFVDVLKLLNVDFRVFMSSKTEQAGHPIVPAETLNKILDFLPQLQSFNEMLLKDLTDRLACWDKQKKIADIFVKKGPFLKLYSSYIRNFEHATALLDETCKKHNGFGMALQQFEMSPRCASLALKHYMLKPIQRIPQYKLLLQDYLKHLTAESPDYKDTITALNIVSEVADHANESMRHGDNVQKLLEIQRSLIGQFEVIQPGRVLIKQGELMKMSRKEMQPRMFFLFSDVLLYTTPTATGYRLNNILPLQGMKVLPPKLEEFNNEFNIITTQRSFTVATNTQEEREEWLRALWNAIEENSERYHTFKAMRQEPKTSLLDKDFVLGTKAPLWVPDARVTMCMLCLAEFSITWRRHHCRACGRIICGNCSENKAPLRYLVYKPARVCDECFEKLAKEVDEGLEKEQKPQGDKATQSTTPTTPVSSSATAGASPSMTASTHSSVEPSVLSFSSIKARFQKIRKSARDRRKSGQARPSVLKEVHANDEGSDMSGYLWVAKNKKWKRLWFVVKGKVLYTYKASEDMAAIESMPLLGFEITRMTSWYQGAEPDLMFELHHRNTQPLVFKPRHPSSSSTGNSERNSQTVSEDGSKPTSPNALSPHVKSSVDTTTPRLIFRTDSAAATTKWLNVLREASLA